MAGPFTREILPLTLIPTPTATFSMFLLTRGSAALLPPAAQSSSGWREPEVSGFIFSSLCPTSTHLPLAPAGVSAAAGLHSAVQNFLPRLIIFHFIKRIRSRAKQSQSL